MPSDHGVLLAVAPSPHLEEMFPPTDVANKFSALSPCEQRLLISHPQSHGSSISGSESTWAGFGWQTPLFFTLQLGRLLTDSLPPYPCCQAMATGLLPAQPTPAQNPKSRFPSSGISTRTAKPSPSPELGVGGGVYLSFAS